MTTLTDLGERICIMGPSGSGKSTLAVAIGHARHLPVIHLDQLSHLPATDWEKRPVGEFITLHDAAITGDRWVMEGNYTRCLPQRLERATGLILLDISTPLSLYRYFRRTLFEKNRHGALAEGKDSIKREMVQYILGPARQNRRHYAAMYQKLTLPKILLPSPGVLRQFYRRENLPRP
ncbi:AAA family ATPase [Acetobacter musti]|uniref:AAA family ATPase n=1 Tax=Acetobacter musti TaxID=864732 RepID=A0ABX0JNW7_9PROT|nr:AAA family ATPase [Acetobacter musti]NHN84675.1 AAA family ATPase [Acetobacter musti]